MVIHLTQKLADKLKISPAKATSVNEFLSWRAHYVQGRGYRLVVFMNDASRFTVVVNDAKAAKLKKLPEMFSHALVDTLYSLNVNIEVIGCYLEDLGEKVFYAKNADRKKTAQLNQQVEAVLWTLEDSFSESSPNDIMLSSFANNFMLNISGKNEFIKPKEKMFDLLGKYGLPVIKCAAFDLKVRLLLGGAGRDAIRSLRVPSNITFEYLHHVLQAAFGWQDYHLYNFGMLKEWDINHYHKPEIKLISNKEDYEYVPDVIYTDSKKLTDYMFKYQLKKK
ncbi:MAG: plasmid pRiA4b ORF-3 family protein [Treponema sp.]|nr:plasmid pRiA4b ORF-3 family protein [Treponema sp.]